MQVVANRMAPEIPWRPGYRNWTLAGKAQGVSCTAGYAEIQPGAGAPLHIHREADEILILIEGRLEVRIGTEKMIVERYSHVMHIVSNVTGRVKGDCSALDVLRATFPAGTLSGAPKIRAMEIIDELEPVKRGIYGGAVGYLSWGDNMDTAIAIRTAVIKDHVLHIQAGGGIVADSVPANEWEESMNKARAIFRAVSMAEQGMD